MRGWLDDEPDDPDEEPDDEPLELPDDREPPPPKDEEPDDAAARAARRAARRLAASACAFLRLAAAAFLARVARLSSAVPTGVAAAAMERTVSLSFPSCGAALPSPRIALEARAALPTTSTTKPTQIQRTFGSVFIASPLPGQNGALSADMQVPYDVIRNGRQGDVT